MDFDDMENVVNKGFNGKVFLDDTLSGRCFNDIDSAFKYMITNGICGKLNHLVYNYLSNDVQYQKVIV